MGMLRSCYTTKARFFRDSQQVDDIIWYWCAEDAAWFPEGHVFAPLIFQGGGTLQINGVGEQPSYPRSWRNGSIPVSPPTQEIDGDLSWFQQGQLTSDPGLERTPFGIPVNCTSPIFQVCGVGGLQHYSWTILDDRMVAFGTSHFVASNLAQFDTVLFPPIVWSLQCGNLAVVPPYEGQLLTANAGGTFVAQFYAPVQVGPEPTYKWSLFVGTTPPNPVYTRFLAGP